MTNNKSGRGRRTTPTSTRTRSRRSRPSSKSKAAPAESLNEEQKTEDQQAAPAGSPGESVSDSDKDSVGDAGAAKEALAGAESAEGDSQSTLSGTSDDSLADKAETTDDGDSLIPPGAHRLTADDILSEDNLSDSSSGDSISTDGTDAPLIEVTAKEIPETDDGDSLVTTVSDGKTDDDGEASDEKSDTAADKPAEEPAEKDKMSSTSGSGGGGGRQPPALPPSSSSGPPPSGGRRAGLLMGIGLGGVLVVAGYVLAVGTSDLWLGKVVSPGDWSEQQKTIAALGQRVAELEGKTPALTKEQVAALEEAQKTASKNLVDATKQIGDLSARVEKLAKDGTGASSEAIDKLSGELAAAKAASAALQKQVSDAMKAAQDKVNAALASGQSGLEALKKDLSDLKDTASKNLESVLNRLSSLEADKGPDPKLTKEIEDLRAEMSGLRAAVSRTETRTKTLFDRLSVDPKTLEENITALQADFKSISEKVSANLAATTKAADQIASLEQVGPALQQGLAKVKEDSDAVGAQLGALKDQIDSFAGELKERIDTAIAAAIAKDMRPRAAALALASASLGDAVRRGGSFQGEFDAVEKLAGSVPELQQDLAALKPLATAGVSSRGGLISSFRAQIPKILEAAAGESEESGDLLDEAWGAVSSLVEVRPVGEVAGETPKAIVARAEQRLLAGNLTEAVSEVASLKGAAATAAAPWLTEARARLLALQAADRLQQAALASLAAQQN